MRMHSIAESELPIDEDGRIYHLKLKPEELADTVITVGDPQRVPRVSAHFDTIEHKIQHREFETHTGIYQGKRISVMSTGMGTPNIDVVINELDALVNIDFKTREVKPELTSLSIIRLGTTGTVDSDIEMGTVIASACALGMDGLMYSYACPQAIDSPLASALSGHLKALGFPLPLYTAEACPDLLTHFKEMAVAGITLTCGGFYGPQGRLLRGPLRVPTLIEHLSHFSYGGLNVTNIEMETAALLALGQLLGHRCHSLSTVLANRLNGEFCHDFSGAVDRMIKQALAKIAKL